MYKDYSFYWNPCRECNKSKHDCYSCRITKLEEELRDTKDELSSAEFKIRTELEPRIRRERHCYDLRVTSGEP